MNQQFMFDDSMKRKLLFHVVRINLSWVLHIQNVMNSNPNLLVTLTRILNGYFSTLSISPEMLRFVRSVRDNLCETFVWNLLTFLPQPGCMKSWYHDKIYDFRSSFAFITILKWLCHMFVVMVSEHNVQNSLPCHGYSLTLGSITWISFFNSLYSNIRNTCSSFLNYLQKMRFMK